MSSTKCDLGFTIKPDGVNELDPCVYKDVEIHKNVTVVIAECVNCGNKDISWFRQPNTEDIYKED